MIFLTNAFVTLPYLAYQSAHHISLQILFWHQFVIHAVPTEPGSPIQLLTTMTPHIHYKHIYVNYKCMRIQEKKLSKIIAYFVLSFSVYAKFATKAFASISL